MRVAIDLVKNGTAHAAVSAGNTGALMAISALRAEDAARHRSAGDRHVLPTLKGDTSSAGSRRQRRLHPRASAAVRHHGSHAGVALVDHKERPTVGLLNIGEEEIKGNDVVKQAGELLRTSGLNFIGNVEGDDIYKGTADVVVCDGFVGNVTLKTSEGLAQMLATFLREEFSRNLLTKLAGLIAMSALKSFKRRVDPRRYNGASLLGLKGIVVKSHGSADNYAFEMALHRAAEEVRNKLEIAAHRRARPPGGGGMIYSRISGTGSYLPGQAVTNDDLVAHGVNTSDEWIVERTGIRKRHLADQEQTASDLALEASRAAIADAGIGADRHRPDHRRHLHPRLHLSQHGGAAAGQTRHQQRRRGIRRAGGVQRFHLRAWPWPTSSSAPAATSCALVVGAEVFSRILDWKDRGTCVLFGDGAGAVVLEAAPQPGIFATALHADGSYPDILSVPGNVCGGKVTGAPFLRMDGQAVFKFAVKVLAEVANEVLAAAEVEAAAGRLADSPSGQHPHPAGDGAQTRNADGEGGGHRG